MSLINGVRVTTSNVCSYVMYHYMNFFPNYHTSFEFYFQSFKKHITLEDFLDFIYCMHMHIFSSQSQVVEYQPISCSSQILPKVLPALVKSLYLSKFANRAIWSKVLLLRSKLWQATQHQGNQERLMSR